VHALSLEPIEQKETKVTRGIHFLCFLRFLLFDSRPTDADAEDAGADLI